MLIGRQREQRVILSVSVLTREISGHPGAAHPPELLQPAAVTVFIVLLRAPATQSPNR